MQSIERLITGKQAESIGVTYKKLNRILYRIKNIKESIMQRLALFSSRNYTKLFISGFVLLINLLSLIRHFSEDRLNDTSCDYES